MDPQRLEVGELAALIPDGSQIVIPPDYSGCAMEVVRRLIARGVRDLHLVGAPTGGFQADMLIGAGCVATLEAAAVTLGEYGPPGRFAAAVKAGEIRLRDSTCPAIHAAMQAAEKGIPFIPLRGVIGSDILKNRPDWKVIENPFAEDGPDPILLLPAIRPDFALFHARAADRNGNVWIGVRRELMLMAHAARRTLVTVERFEDRDFLEDEAMAAGTIPALYIEALAEVREGAWPVGLAGAYPPDERALAAYAQAARDDADFARWLEGVRTPEPT